MGLIVDALTGRVREAVLEEAAMTFAHEKLGHVRDALAQVHGESAQGAPTAQASALLAQVRAQETTVRETLATMRKTGLLTSETYRAYERFLELCERIERAAANSASENAAHGAGVEPITFDTVKDIFGTMLDALDERVGAAATALENAFAFVEQAFGEGQEMLMLVTDLSVNKHSMEFINNHGCDAYFKHNKALLFTERGSDLVARINRLDLSAEEG